MTLSVDLAGSGGDCRFSSCGWARLLALAERFGWEPAGTVPPQYVDGTPFYTDWHGGYTSNDAQLVTDDDARNLAAVLEAILPDIPRHDAAADKGVLLRGSRLVPLEWFSGSDNRELLGEFIRMAKAGGFQIF